MNHNQRATINSLYTITSLTIIAGLILLIINWASIPTTCLYEGAPPRLCEKGPMNWSSLAVLIPGIIVLAGIIVAHTSLPKNAPAAVVNAA